MYCQGFAFLGLPVIKLPSGKLIIFQKYERKKRLLNVLCTKKKNYLNVKI